MIGSIALSHLKYATVKMPQPEYPMVEGQSMKFFKIIK
jgi:hypothetical protein